MLGVMTVISYMLEISYMFHYVLKYQIDGQYNLKAKWYIMNCDHTIVWFPILPTDEEHDEDGNFSDAKFSFYESI